MLFISFNNTILISFRKINKRKKKPEETLRGKITKKKY